MPIEIKEVIVKTTVEKQPSQENSDELDLKNLEEMKKEILRTCEQLINKVLKNQNRRYRTG